MKFPKGILVFGDKSYRGDCYSESAEQTSFFNFIRINYDDIGKIALHPRNEGKKTAYQHQIEVAEGMAVGASDIIIPGNPTFVCELKRRDHTKSKWQPGQIGFLEQSKKMGAFTCVALGATAAIEAFIEWQKKALTDEG